MGSEESVDMTTKVGEVEAQLCFSEASEGQARLGRVGRDRQRLRKRKSCGSGTNPMFPLRK
jgi:hypothetical protein